MDYQHKTTFMMDFNLANMFGESAVRDTLKRAFEEWQHDTVYVTELTMVLNWQIWQLYQKNEKLARVYDELWREMDKWCMENLKGEDLTYYIRTTD